MEAFLLNKQLTHTQTEKLGSVMGADNPVLFAIVSSITGKAQYSDTTLAATKDCLFVFDNTTLEADEPIRYSEIDSITNKRMYGNGTMRAKMKDGTTKDIFRFTFTDAGLCDAAMYFVNSLIGGTPLDEALDSMKATYEKQLSVCPKCGRTLSAPGVKCINCESKKRIIHMFFGYMKPEMLILVISVFISVLTTALALVPPFLTGKLVDSILPNKQLKMLYTVSIGLVLIYVLRFGLGALRGHMLRISGDKIIASLKKDVYEKSQYLPMRFYDKTSTGAVINRINGDTATLQSFMLRITQEVVVQFFKMIGIIVIMLVLNPQLTLFSLFPVPIVVIGARIFSKKIAPFYRRIWRRSSAVSSVLTDTLPGIRVIKSFTNEQNSTAIFKDAVGEWYQTDVRASKMLNIFPAIVNCFISCGTVIIWSYGGGLVINGSTALSVGLLVSFISYASMFYEPINFFANLSDSYQSALAAAERIMDILDAEPEHDFGKGNILPNIKGKIEFKNVSFSFDRTKKVLKNINLTIEPGDIVGIVGTTGSGKSTLINLLLRYYDNYEGKILVGGVNIRKIDMEYYRSKIGYVQQEPLMFHDTIYNNIAYGADYTVEEVIHAADIANAHSFIVRQPDAYDSVLGERGVGLSGGERQRLSIARAVLKNPSMLVFDEATASVDSETEHLIQEAIEHLISGRTTIMIAHRLSTLSKANKIVVIDNGRIIECDTPENLMAMKGKYYKLVQIQSMSDKVRKSKEEENFE